MKKNILIFALIALAMWFMINPITRKQPKNLKVDAQVKVLVDKEVKRVNKTIDEKGFEHAVISEVENTIGDITMVSESLRREIDSVTRLLNIKDRQLRHLLVYNTTLKDSLLTATKVGDTMVYSDKWTRLEYISDSLGNAGHFNFQYDAQVNYSEYWRMENIFKAKQHYIDFWISDPRVRINGVERIKIATQQRSDVFELNAITLYDRGLYMGFDSRLNIGRFSIGGAYVYSLDDQKWRPIITARGNLITF